MICSVAVLSERDYNDVVTAVKEELLTVTDTYIIWRTVLAQKADIDDKRLRTLQMVNL
jgi:hypothetical protein